MYKRVWYIHLGAHKTATTHIQSELEARRGELSENGVLYLPLNKTREFLRFENIQRPLWWRAAKKFPGGIRQDTAFASKRFATACASRFRSLVNQEANDAERVVLSEENFLGTTSDVFTRDYFSGSRRLNLINEISKKEQVELFISVRSLDSFLPSAYAQALRTIPADKLDFANYLERVLQRPPSWANLIDQVNRYIPNAKITVWDYDDYSSNSLEVQNLITGCELKKRVELKRPMTTKSPNVKAIEFAEVLSEKNWRERRAAVNEIYAAHPATNSQEQYRPISKTMRERMQAAYQNDLIEISNRRFVNLVSFGN